MPETVLMMSSTGLLTVVSISSTLAPGSTVVTVHTGKSTLGKRSTPSSLYETSPITTGIATSTQVNTGRLMQRSEIVMGTPVVRRWLWGADHDRSAVGELGLAGDDDHRRSGKALARDLDPAGTLGTGDDVVDRPGLAVLDAEQLGDAGEANDRLGRGDGCLGCRVGDDRRLGEAAGPQQAPVVGNLGLDLKRPADGVDRGIDPHDLAFEGEFGLRRHRDAHRLANPHALGVPFRGARPEPQRVLDDQLTDRFALPDHLPFGDRPSLDSIGDRRSPRAGRGAEPAPRSVPEVYRRTENRAS